LIGGATTSRAHTALRIAPHHAEPVVWVKDASRAVGVMQSLLSETLRAPFVASVEADYAEVRARHAGRGDAKPLLSLARSREKRFDGGWDSYTPPQPLRPGVSVFDDVALSELRAIFDWTPFFQTWELSGRYPQILDDAEVGAQARELFADAQSMLDEIIAGKWLTAKAVAGLWPAASVGDDITVAAASAATLHCLRQQADKPDDRANFCLADFIAPADSGVSDWVGAFAVNAGIGIEPHLARFEAQYDDYRSILLKSLADRFAEACAEWLHRKVRMELWGYAPDEQLEVEALVKEAYRGIRPAPGYPACPEHSEKATVFELLDAEANIGLALTESYAMFPASSVSGLYFSHPRSQYFVVGRLSREQVSDYARRKGVPMSQAERWLASNLDYDPE
ncbi:MAG: vitamin B12 dependent-methionine synthase activation domain-containing protein, partial [Arenimonas sp.]